MLPQNFQRKAARPQSRQSKNQAIFQFASLCLCALALTAFSSCGSKTADLRTYIPADSLIYLESNDLGDVMKTITDRPAFRETAKTVPDFSALNGVKLAVAVTGFETKEQPVTEENSVLSFQPRFVAVLDTNAWNFQALSFTENKLGEFINRVYDGEVLLETSDKHDGKYFVWKANDGRKAYALVQGSVVYFGNDETAIEKCLAVKRGEADSIAKNPKITNGDRLAFGYVSPDGVAQLANIAGLSLAKNSSEEGDVQSFIARVLPGILRNSLKEATWTAKKNDDGIVDSFMIFLDTEISSVLNETLTPLRGTNVGLPSLRTDVAPALTRYRIQNPLVAWRSLVLSAGKTADPTSGSIIVSFSDGLFESYGIEDPEKFLKSVEPEFFTVRTDVNGEDVAVIAKVKDPVIFEQSLARELVSVKVDAGSEVETIRKSADGELSLVTRPSGVIFLGNANAVEMILNGMQINLSEQPFAVKLFESDALAATTGVDKDAAGKIVSFLSEPKPNDVQVNSFYFTETRFDRNRFERRTVSDFGFIGWIITQFAKE